jgi:hypothetical protein
MAKVKNIWMLDAGYWMLDAGCWMLDAGCWMLDAGCWMLDAGCWGPTPALFFSKRGGWGVSFYGDGLGVEFILEVIGQG